MLNNRKQQGFTLVELSIVLVIIGLVAAGVLVGRSMVKNKELQKIASDLLKFQDAAKQFHDKYKYLPGDFPDAMAFWGAGDCVTASDNPMRETCNGDGNGLVGRNSPIFAESPAYLSVDPQEIFYFWQHLTNAGFIEGAYSGRKNPANTWRPGTNIPAGEDGAGYTFYFAGNQAPLPFSIETRDLGTLIGNNYEASYGHVISYGKPTLNGGISHPPVAPALSAESAAIIDTKIDDGKPGLGKIVAMTVEQGGENYCGDDSFASVATYRTIIDERYCTLFFITGL